MTGFRITGGKGLHVTFDNGWTISVQIGPGKTVKHAVAKHVKRELEA